MFTKSLFRNLRGLLLAGVAVALALATMAFAPAAAYAQGEEPPAAPPEPGVRWGGGTVTAIEGDVFGLHTRHGRDLRVHVDDSTVFFNSLGRPASYADLKVGARVAGSIEIKDDGEAYALLVIIFPEQTRYKGAGVVTELEADAFHFVNRRGKVWEFYVDDATSFTNRAGEALTFADLEAEARVFVVAELRDDGQWWALEVKLGR